MHLYILILYYILHFSRSQWPRGLRRRSAAARLLRSWVRIPPGECECCVLSGRGLCDELIIRPEESYRLWCVVVCDVETSRMRRPWPALRRSATAKKKINILTIFYIKGDLVFYGIVIYMCVCVCVCGTRWRSWLTKCARSRKVAGSIPDGVIGIFHWQNPSGRTMALGLTQPLTEMSIWNISWGVKAAGA